MSQLRECPFCGSNNRSIEVSDGPAWVSCCDCLAEGPVIPYGIRTTQSEQWCNAEAVSLWNQRSGRSHESWQEALRLIRKVRQIALVSNSLAIIRTANELAKEAEAFLAEHGGE